MRIKALLVSVLFLVVTVSPSFYLHVVIWIYGVAFGCGTVGAIGIFKLMSKKPKPPKDFKEAKLYDDLRRHRISANPK